LGNWSSVTTDGTTQTRTANQQNEITSISGQTTPAYDANGNMTTDQTGNTLVFDPWNRLVQVKSGSTQLQAYSYDPLGRRVTENPGTAKSLYYSSSWQILEERWSSATQVQYVWSPVYVDAMIERDRGSERFYVQQDANWNVTAIVSTSGAVQERYIYDPYGQTTILDPSWNSRSTSSFAWVYLHQGGRYDFTTSLYALRHRDYSPALGRWVQVDLAGNGSGDANLYRFVQNSPATFVDPSGLIGVFIDGYGQNGRQQVTNVFQLYLEYKDSNKQYFGVGWFSGNQPYNDALRWTKDQLAEAKRNCKNINIDMFGWSRGAVFAVWVTQRIKPAHVRFLGLIDPVSRGIVGAGNSETVPSSVSEVYQAIRDGNYDGMDNAGLFPITSIIHQDGVVHTQQFKHSHAQMGFADDVRAYLKEKAKAAGAPM
jgi:RHS repeat-associated protein